MSIQHRDSHLKDCDCLTMYLKNGRYIIYIALYYYRLYFKEALKFTVSSLLQRVLENTSDPPLPASMVKPHHGDLYWYLDQGAATLLANKEKIMNCWTSMQQLVVSELFHWQFLTCSSVEIIRFHIKFCRDMCKIVQQYYNVSLFGWHQNFIFTKIELCMQNSQWNGPLGPLIPTWINFNPSMDK